MLTRARSFLTSNRDASRLVERAEKFSIRLPVVGKVAVPPPDQLAFYGALGALAAGGLIDWPVVLAIGVGQIVVARHFSDRSAAPPPAAPSAREERAAAPAKAATPARKTPARKTPARKTATPKAARAATPKAAKTATPKAAKTATPKAARAATPRKA